MALSKKKLLKHLGRVVRRIRNKEIGDRRQKILDDIWKNEKSLVRLSHLKINAT